MDMRFVVEHEIGEHERHITLSDNRRNHYLRMSDYHNKFLTIKINTLTKHIHIDGEVEYIFIYSRYITDDIKLTLSNDVKCIVSTMNINTHVTKNKNKVKVNLKQVFLETQGDCLYYNHCVYIKDSPEILKLNFRATDNNLMSIKDTPSSDTFELINTLWENAQ